MTDSIKLGFAGSYKCDLILYLSRILHNAGKKVAIVDASEEQLFRYCVPLKFESDTMVTYREVDVYYKIKNEEDYESALKENYDVLLIDVGFNKNMTGLLRRSDYCIFITDPQIHNIQMMKDYTGIFAAEAKDDDRGKETHFVRIFRDMCPGKINYKYLSSIIDSPDSLSYIGEYVFMLDEVDRGLRLYCQYDHIFKFTKLSKEYKIMFADMLETFFNMDKKLIKKSIKKAERGR